MSKSTIYDHRKIESDYQNFWRDRNIFEPNLTKKFNDNFSIILPPPNVTGKLHLGHAWDSYLQDTIIRYKKHKGFNVAWLPGKDHAGIATQTKFEKILIQNNNGRFGLSDQEFLIKLNEWAQQRGVYIQQQWSKMGLALSYKNETFTLDKNVSDLVNKTFKRLYDDGLIYQDYKLVNWDVNLKTAISDIEVVHKKTNSYMHYIKYKIKDTTDFLTIATTRPETIFVDVALFVNPTDKRYQKFIHKYAINPLNGETLKIYADTYVDKNFGTGVLKCTPAHDFHDRELAIRHNIKEYHSVMNHDGTLNEYAKSKQNNYDGVDRLIARQNVIEELKANDLLVKTKEIESEIGYSERTNEIIEPLLSKQWFIKMKPLAKKSISLIQKQNPNFLPPRFKQVMLKWINNVEDWCISRQLLWGHRIPIWYHKKTKAIVVGQKPISSSSYEQDNNVLDTWFSSGLWPIALTKNAMNKKLLHFYRVDTLVTGYDILFFWVARMFFLCGYLTNQVPFKNVLFHGLVRDEMNRKMSKSLDNGIDPMNVIDEYGSDALHIFLVSTATQGEDLRYSSEKIKFHWTFLNKVWNAHNFIAQFPNSHSVANVKHTINKWILESLNKAIPIIVKNMDRYNFVIAYKHIQDFIWDEFCNKYLEYVKPLLKNSKYKNETIFVLHYIFKQILILLHPFAPFVAETIYQSLFHKEKSIALEIFPTKTKKSLDKNEKITIEAFNAIYECGRTIRIKQGIKAELVLQVNLIIDKNLINQEKLNKLTCLFNINVNITSKKGNEQAQVVVINNFVIECTTINLNPEKLNIELKRLKNEIERSQKILTNENFINKASKEKVALEKEKYQQYLQQYQKVQEYLKNKK